MIDLKAEREKSNLTQEQLADLAHVKRTTITMIENGSNKPSVPLAQQLGKILGFDWKGLYE